MHHVKKLRFMKKSRYLSTIKKTAFKYRETKKIAGLMVAGLGPDEIYKNCVEENYIGIESPSRRREVSRVVYMRLSSLDNFLLHEFIDADIASSKYILVYAIAKTDTLFFEFLFERYQDSLLSPDRNYLSMDDFDDFFREKKERDERVAKWGNFTLEDLISGYRNILVDSGLGKRNGKNILIKQVLIHPAVAQHIRQLGDVDFLRATLKEI